MEAIPFGEMTALPREATLPVRSLFRHGVQSEQWEMAKQRTEAATLVRSLQEFWEQGARNLRKISMPIEEAGDSVCFGQS